MAQDRKRGAGSNTLTPKPVYRTSSPPAQRLPRKPKQQDSAMTGAAEIGEFVEFFTQTRPDLIAEYLDQEPTQLLDAMPGPYVPENEQEAAPATRITPALSFGAPAPQRGRLARATERVKEFILIRPTVSLSWLNRGNDKERQGWLGGLAARLPRQIKAPPLWVVAQLAILVTILIGVLPQIINNPSPTGCAWYTVQSGDTLSDISTLVGVSAKTIAQTNHLTNNAIHANQRLCIPGPTGGPLAVQVGLASINIDQLAPSQVLNGPSDVRHFIAFALPYARETSAKTGWPVSMILGQWGLEKSWRTYTFTGYNWGNCGAMPGFPAIPGTSVPGSPNQFAFANTPEQGVAEYVHVAHLHYYSAIAPAWQSGGANAAARALGASPWDWGHYTAIGSPGSSIIALMQRYNLYWFDTH